MDRRLTLPLLALAATSLSIGNASEGQNTYATYCASCHGQDGAGLVGPNLTDAEILHGSAIEDIRSVVKNGVLGKSMPAWGDILSATELENVSAYVHSIMGKNLVGPQQGTESTVTPFPRGTQDRPLLMRTFMPALDLPESIFPHHGKGEGTPRYNPNTAETNPEKIDPPIKGIPAAIAVNFGETLSYCFDTTECRLLYTWKGPFLDMTNYWGAGEGGGRKSFDYLPDILGEIVFLAQDDAPFSGAPDFQGYRKENNVPVFEYTVADHSISLKITPGEEDGSALCQYTCDTKNDLVIRLPASERFTTSCESGQTKDGVLYLSADQAGSFTLKISPRSPAP